MCDEHKGGYRDSAKIETPVKKQSKFFWYLSKMSGFICFLVMVVSFCLGVSIDIKAKAATSATSPACKVVSFEIVATQNIPLHYMYQCADGSEPSIQNHQGYPFAVCSHCE